MTCTYSTGVGAGPGAGPESTESTASRRSTADAYDGASSSASPPKRRHIEAEASTGLSISADMQQLHQQQQQQQQQQHFTHHSHGHSGSIHSLNSNASPISPVSQPKVEADGRARLKLGSMPSVATSSSSSAPRAWSGRNKDVIIELETSFLQNNGPAQGPASGHRSTPLNRGSSQPSSSGMPAGDRTRDSSTSGPDEEAVMFHTSRMLKDPRGRLRKLNLFAFFVFRFSFFVFRFPFFVFRFS